MMLSCVFEKRINRSSNRHGRCPRPNRTKERNARLNRIRAHLEDERDSLRLGKTRIDGNCGWARQARTEAEDAAWGLVGRALLRLVRSVPGHRMAMLGMNPAGA